MKPKIRGIKTPFILACLLAVPIIIWILFIFVSYVLLSLVEFGFSGNFDTGLSFLPLILALCASVLIFFIIKGIYLKKHLAFTVATIVFPLTVAFIFPKLLMTYFFHGNNLPFASLIVFYLVAIVVMGVYMNELRLNSWR